MTGQRVTAAAAERLKTKLTDRDFKIIRSLQQTRVLTGDQLTRLHFTDLSPRTQSRIRRGVMERLTAWKVVTRVDRTIGGVRAGSTGWVYALGPVGQRLVQLHAIAAGSSRIRPAWTPSTLFLQHSLSVAEIYVQLVEASRGGHATLATFETEPGCWWPDGLGGWLKPDAFVVLSGNRYDELIWLEVDRGTESLPTLRRKLDAYASFASRGQRGPSEVMPHVVISTTTQRRAEDISAVIAHIGSGPDFFRVTIDEHVTEQLLALAEEPP